MLRCVQRILSGTDMEDAVRTYLMVLVTIMCTIGTFLAGMLTYNFYKDLV